MARKARNTYAQRQAARQRARHRPVAIGMGLAFLAFSGSLAALLVVATLDALAGGLAPTVSPDVAAFTLATGALFAIGCAVIGALALWEARP